MIVRWALLVACLVLPVTVARAETTVADSSAAAPTVASPSLPTGAAHGWQSGALRADRLQHASLAFAIGAGVGAASRRAEVGAGTALLLGVAKEFLDDHVDGGDLIADAAGASLAALVVAALTRGAR